MRERIRDMLQRGRVIVYISPNATVRETAELMDRHNVGSVLVMDEKQKLVGIFTERDLLKRVVAVGLDADQTPISEVMTSEVVVVDGFTVADDVFELMNQKKCRHIPVAEGDQVLGVISLRDLLRRDRTMKELEISQLRTYFLNPGYPA